jgi:hypothetical protein
MGVLAQIRALLADQFVWHDVKVMERSKPGPCLFILDKKNPCGNSGVKFNEQRSHHKILMRSNKAGAVNAIPAVGKYLKHRLVFFFKANPVILIFNIKMLYL